MKNEQKRLKIPTKHVAAQFIAQFRARCRKNPRDKSRRYGQ
ncbi:hypothetical protein L579_0105 [Pantoea sp. AS-PWVM4]|nr:hypothetical protein L579_0105 [Pantoea sp. AS-PWVM4]